MSAPVSRRVQRVPETWPVVHLEREVPTWDGLVVDGLVRHPGRFDLAALAALGKERRRVPINCVWGWSRADPVWEGVGLDRLLDVAEPEGGWVTVSAASGTYSGCLPLADAARGLLVWGRDGAPLAPEAGGPLRFVTPPEYWAYKGVKWAARVTVVDRSGPGPGSRRSPIPSGSSPTTWSSRERRRLRGSRASRPHAGAGRGSPEDGVPRLPHLSAVRAPRRRPRLRLVPRPRAVREALPPGGTVLSQCQFKALVRERVDGSP